MADTNNIAFYKIFHTFIQTFLPSETIRLLDGNFVAPQGPYIAMKLAKSDPVSIYPGWVSPPTDVTGRGIMSTSYLGSMVIRCYGLNAYSRALSIAHHFRDSSLRYTLLSQKGIGYAGHTSPTDDSQQIDNQVIEERGTLTVEFYYTLQNTEAATDDISVIETVTLDPTFTNDC